MLDGADRDGSPVLATAILLVVSVFSMIGIYTVTMWILRLVW